MHFPTLTGDPIRLTLPSISVDDLDPARIEGLSQPVLSQVAIGKLDQFGDVIDADYLTRPVQLLVDRKSVV